jgi:PAS domain S-box-containing protein
VGFFTDVTERKKAEEALKEAKAFTESTLNSITDLFYSFDLSGKFLSWNKTFSRISGYSDQELSSKKPIDFFLGEDIQRIAEAVERIYKEGISKTEANFVLKDGRQIPCEFTGSILKDNKDNIIGFSGTGRDLTERKRVEEKLRASEHKYKTLLENLSQKIFYKDKNSVYVSCNENYAHDLGIKPEEIAGKTDYDFYPKDLAEKYRADDKRIMEAGKSEDIEEKYIKDGQETVVYTVKTPVGDEQGNIIGILGIFWDITERKQTEEKEKKLLEEIESANRELKDFAYVVSHDLKAPLRGIKTLASWLSADYADKLDEQGKEQIRLLSGRVDRMNNLINGVLEYSRVGRIQEKQSLVDLNKLVPEIIDMIAPPENINITVENELPKIECEPTRITQVFQNLLSNAVKYMDKPQGLIKVGCIEENGFWKFSVSDNGPGIEEKFFEKIFQIFQTLAPRDSVESTGIGLTVAKKIVELYGGRIWVESKVGVGSTFFFTLPKQEIEVKNAELEAHITC